MGSFSNFWAANSLIRLGPYLQLVPNLTDTADAFHDYLYLLPLVHSTLPPLVPTSSIYHLIFISIAPFSDAGLTRESYNPSNSPNPTDSTFSRSFDTRQPSSMPPPTTMKTSSAPSSTVDPPTQAPTPLQTSFQALYDASSNLSTFKALLADSPSNMWESPNGRLWTRMEI